MIYHVRTEMRQILVLNKLIDNFKLHLVIYMYVSKFQIIYWIGTKMSEFGRILNCLTCVRFTQMTSIRENVWRMEGRI